MKYMNLKPLTFLLFILSGCFLYSCTDTKKTTYFNNQPDAVIQSSSNVPETIIQPKDILGISVSSLNPTASAVFNAPNLSYANASSENGNTLQSSGYLVDSAGFIQFPIIGNIKAAGYSCNQLKVIISKQLTDKNLLVDPIVAVRYLNYRVTVLGEVNHPAVITVPSEKISLLEAIGLAGDITVYGRKDNVMVIRETDNTKQIKRLDLNSNEIFNSPFYYLKSNDIVYVEANKAKVSSSSKTMQLLPIIFSGLSLIAIIVDGIVRNN
jgi:polysaccharide export outer membrane protein